MLAHKMKATMLALWFTWMLVWAFPVAGAFAEGVSSTIIIDGADKPIAISVFEDLDVSGIIEAQLSWYSFGPMGEPALNEAIAKLGAFADDYDFIGRVSLDGQYGYIAGVLKPGRNPAAEGRGVAGRLSDGAYIFYNADSPSALIVIPSAYAREKGFGLEYGELYGYVTGGNSDYLKDATRRGVTVCAPPVPYLRVYILENGQHRYEYIRLTEEDLKKATSDKYMFKSETIGSAMSLVTSEAEAEYGDGAWDIPASLYLMAVERCGFTVASPRDIGTIVQATMTFTTRQGEARTQVVTEKAALKKLASILKHAKKTDLSNCPFTAVLTMVMKDGRVVTVQKATDSCGALVFGSAMCYEISDKANGQFWKIFSEIRKESPSGGDQTSEPAVSEAVGKVLEELAKLSESEHGGYYLSDDCAVVNVNRLDGKPIDIPGIDQDFVRIYPAKYSLKALRDLQEALTPSMQRLHIQALWVNFEQNRLEVHLFNAPGGVESEIEAIAPESGMMVFVKDAAPIVDLGTIKNFSQNG